MKKTIVAAVIAALSISAPSANAQKAIFKCSGPNGSTVFSQSPCGKDSKEVTVRSDAPATSDNAAVAAISASVSDMHCRDDAYRDTLGIADGNIERMQREKSRLEADTRRAANNMAGAMWESGLRKQIGDIDNAIVQERANAQAAYRQAIQVCDAAKATAKP